MPLKRIKRAFKKVTKPIAKVLDKVVPNEIKPFLPYAAAIAPVYATRELLVLYLWWINPAKLQELVLIRN